MAAFREMKVPGQRNWRTNVTILSGNIGSSADAADNSYSIFQNVGRPAAFACDSTAVLDGFTLSGAAEAAMLNSEASPTVRNCIFTGNSGGRGSALQVDRAVNMTVANCVFTDNRTGYGVALLEKVLGNFAELLVLQKSFHARGRSISTFGTTNAPGMCASSTALSPITMPALTRAV